MEQPGTAQIISIDKRGNRIAGTKATAERSASASTRRLRAELTVWRMVYRRVVGSRGSGLDKPMLLVTGSRGGQVSGAGVRSRIGVRFRFPAGAGPGVESEVELAFAGLQQLCAPLLGGLGQLPDAQRADLIRLLGRGRALPADAQRTLWGWPLPQSARAALSALAERREVAGGVAAYLGAGNSEDFGAVPTIAERGLKFLKFPTC
jgi:hypothetical protein